MLLGLRCSTGSSRRIETSLGSVGCGALADRGDWRAGSFQNILNILIDRPMIVLANGYQLEAAPARARGPDRPADGGPRGRRSWSR